MAFPKLCFVKHCAKSMYIVLTNIYKLMKYNAKEYIL